MPTNSRHTSVPSYFALLPLLFLAGAAIVTGFVSSISIIIPIAILVGIILILIVLKYSPPYAETLYFFYPLIYPLIPALIGVAEYKNWFALVWVIGLMGLLFTDGWRFGWQKRWIKTPFIGLLTIYIAILIVSTLINPLNERALSYLLQTLATIPVYWMIAQSLTRYNLDRILMMFIIAAVVNSITFMIFFLHGTPQLTIAGFLFGFLRPMVLGVKANLWPYPSLIAIPIFIVYFIHRSWNLRQKFWLLAGLIVTTAIVVINMSRSVILGLSVSTFFILWTHEKWRRRMIIGGVVLGIIAIFTLPLYFETLESLLRLRLGLTGRGELWKLSVQAILHDPLFGLGPANLGDRFILISPFMRNGAMINADVPSAHNLYLQVAVEIGVLGALVSLAIILLFFYRSWKLWPRLIGTPYFPALVAITAAVFAAFIRSFFETDLALQHGQLYKNLFILISLAIQDQLSDRAARHHGG